MNMPALQNISVTVLAKNSQKYMSQVLGALQPFGEVILYDTGSSDNTMQIARNFKNVKIVEADFVGFGPTHNLASAAARYDWILSIDSDEIVSKEMTEAIRSEKLDEEAVYLFPRNNYFNGQFIKGCGWHPDRQIRLYNRQKTRFSDDQVHEAIISQGMKKRHLAGPIIHYSYHNISDFLAKMQSYSTLFAQQNCGKRESSLLKAIGHGAFAFFKSYFLKLGILDGYAGYVISAYNGHTAYYKYLKLYEANCTLKSQRQQHPHDAH